MLIGVVAIALGLAAAGGFGSDGDRTDAAARRAEISCEPGGTRVRTDRVLSMRDGVHLVVENGAAATQLEIRSSNDALLGEVPLSIDAPTEAVFALPPGPSSVTCATDGLDPDDAHVGVLTVLDPKDRWVSPDLACADEDVERTELVTALIPTERPASTARRAVPALRGSDDLQPPGYPGSGWQGDLLIVRREGETVARIARADDNGEWHVFVEACAGSGFTDA